MSNFKDLSNRNTLYIDESGVGSFKDDGRYFILTAIIANNNEMRLVSEYYFHLKNKYFKDNISIHSNEFFWRPTDKIKLFIPELINYLETIPFGILTIVIDKDKILKETKEVSIKYPYRTKFAQAKSIWQQSGLAPEKFEDKSVKEVLKTIQKFKIKNIDNHYPLRTAYKTLLKEYINNYAKSFRSGSTEFEICFETSPNRERILKYTEDFYNEKKVGKPKEKTSFATKLKENVYSISFPNKSSRYLGLEIADIVSYGFNLSRYKRFDDVKIFKPLWDIISKKRIELKKEYGVNCLIEIPRKSHKKKK